MSSFLSTFPHKELFSHIENLTNSIEKLDLRADHICWKCGSHEEYNALKNRIKKEGYEYIFESLISKRDISIIAFNSSDSLKTQIGSVKYLELSDQKIDGSQKSGWDHIEVYSGKFSSDELAGLFEKEGYKLKKKVRPHHTTYDLDLKFPIKVRLCDEKIIEKIKREEML